MIPVKFDKIRAFERKNCTSFKLLKCCFIVYYKLLNNIVPVVLFYHFDVKYRSILFFLWKLLSQMFLYGERLLVLVYNFVMISTVLDTHPPHWDWHTTLCHLPTSRLERMEVASTRSHHSFCPGCRIDHAAILHKLCPPA